MFFNFKNAAPKETLDPRYTVEEKFNIYYGECLANNSEPTLTGLANMLGCSSLVQLKEYAEENIDVQRLILKVHQNYEEHLIKKGGSTSGAQFALTSMFGWKNEHTVNIKKDMTVDDLRNMTTEELQTLLDNDGDL